MSESETMESKLASLWAANVTPETSQQQEPVEVPGLGTQMPVVIERQIRFRGPAPPCANKTCADQKCCSKPVSSDSFSVGEAVFAQMCPPVQPLKNVRDDQTTLSSMKQPSPVAGTETSTQLMQLVAENARLRAQSEAREEMGRLKDRFQQAMLQLRLENAELVTRQELAVERQDLLVFETHLAVENARLQSHAEHAAQREEMLSRFAEAAVEKAQLEAYFESALEREEIRESLRDEVIETARLETAAKSAEDRDTWGIEIIEGPKEEFAIQSYLEEMAVELEREKAEKTRLETRVAELERLIQEVSSRSDSEHLFK
ncbi:MAG: hypothetical protein P8N76_18755 [Pirellulaceae bacterium]|nr:hypothetical protein [Pirellulaceae bacterium]